ncbi:acyl-CoA dehydrogenase [Sporosarcina sp. P21c]|uniref:acyl-CoA dehydrogenase family protein n=1 Tax=unclassified Sporosarcina TaxID=2647733 RepID=UPI000C16A0B9|nr:MULTISPECIES: acyl-CoA dehydrogenase family protein [unclassified Sporosarcina]PIC67056.1 acyl-CoA dehydrogenase [Sporosarcina sp. P16a]PIC89781.1 acyl-CoA dehydrogenase [Sporosarcina sp. P21c]PIC92510.1 acyl-CoA dehydrogenase [Sporosarcina sp. P25]
MSTELFITTDFQRRWVDQLTEAGPFFSSFSEQSDELSKFPKENIEKLVKMGYTTLTLPKEFGGAGITVTDMVLFQETIARFDSATALAIGWHQGVVGELYESRKWTEEQLAQFSEAIQQGALVNRSVTEAQTGSPTRGGQPQTTASRTKNGWVISGEKTFTTMAPALTHILVSVWIEEKQKTGFFLLPSDTAGLSIRDTWHTISMRGTESQTLVLDQVEATADQLVEVNEASRGNKQNGWLLHIPACYMGIAQAARDYAVHFAATYQPNSLNEPIASLFSIQTQIGKMDLELIKARHLLYDIARIYDDPARRVYLQNELGVAKSIVTNSAIEIVNLAMRIVGAKSLELSNPLQRHYRDVRAGLHNPPMDDMTITKLAQAAISGQQ